MRGARTHKLKNIKLNLQRNKLTVITGLSGSGKSSLAFDTLYAEGQRRYVESLSAHAQQFLERGLREQAADGVVAAGWPAYDERVAKADEVEIAVQVNGKVRGRVVVAADASEDVIREAALTVPQVVPHLQGKSVRKVVIVPGRLVNVVV